MIRDGSKEKELLDWVKNQRLEAVQLNPQCNAYAIEAYRLVQEKILSLWG